ncbi:SAV_915 family protein [Streptomyces sp. NPDC046197]|uniref:SAV_915 family protein n=1 Tax=Streptomyces sp. NPDC046197 TaxID=3154337 RepID=UPI0033F507E0
MEAPIPSRILDYVEPEPQTASSQGAQSPRSRLLDYVAAAPPAEPVTDGRPGPKPGVPPYHTPVFVPAHPRYADTTDAEGRPARVAFIAYELYAHPSGGTVAFAFTELGRLVDALGDAQPWIAVSIGSLAQGMREHGATVVLDPRLAPGQHNWRPEDLAAFAREVR